MSKTRKNVYERMHAVMEEVGVIPKNGRNSFQNYDYATEADFVHAIRPSLIKHGLVIFPAAVQNMSLSEGDKGQKLTNIVLQYKIVAIDDPKDYTTLSIPAQGADKGDKGVYKAITGAKKYMLANTFMVATGDDPEKEEPKKYAFKPAKSSSKSEDF